MIKTIIFDLGNVIVDVDWENFYKKIAEDSGQTIGYIEKYHKNSIDRKNFEKGRINFKQFYEKLAGDLNLKISQNKFKKCYCNIFTLNYDVANLIKKLKKNFRLILLSNTSILHYKYIKNKYKILNLFDDYVLSYEVGCRKPNPPIFFEAIKKSKTLPFNCVYFDDFAAFVFVARLMGIKAFQYKNCEKLVNDLKNADIL